MQAKDIMTPCAIAVSPDTPIYAIARALAEYRISGVPVVDGGKVVGIVSEGDLMRRPELGTDKSRRSWWLEMLMDETELAKEFVKTHGKLARDVMSSPVVSVNEDTPVADVAATLEKHHIKRVPVLRDGRLVGIISRANLVQCLAASGGRDIERPTAASDEEIRQRLIETLEKQPWASVHNTSVFVRNGVVELWGFVESEDEKRATRIAAEEIPGVKQVIDHRALRPVTVGI
jgi:CBS domain-containing protein